LCLLLMATLVWGGCVSCPQFFVTQAGAGNPHGCCNKPVPSTDHHSKPSKNCVLQPLDVPAPVADAAPAGGGFEAVRPGDGQRFDDALIVVGDRTSPPDRLALHHILLI
jgi:hypothetical protein